MKRWQRMLVAQAVAALLTCALVGVVVATLVLTIEAGEETRWLGFGALAIVFLGASQITAIRDRILGR